MGLQDIIQPINTLSTKSVILIYRRVSTDEQNIEGASMEAQYDNAILKAKEMRLEGTFMLFEDAGVSATKVPLKQRAGLVAMLECIQEHRPQYLLAWKRDRLARNLQEYKQVLTVAYKAETQIVFFGKGEPPIGQGTYGQFQENIIMSLIEMETKISRGRIIDTHKDAVISGHYLNSTPPYGYRYIPKSAKYELVPEEAAIVKKIYYLYLVEKRGYLQIAAILNDEGLKSQRGSDWHGNTVRRILKNPTYYGKRPASYLIENEHGFEKRVRTYIQDDKAPPIITKEEFEEVQQLLSSRLEKRRPPRYNKTSFLFSGIIKCAKCGLGLFSHTCNHKYTKVDGTVNYVTSYYYRCSGYRYNCHGGIKKETLEQALINELTIKLATLDFESILAEAEKICKEEELETQMVLKGTQTKINELTTRLATNQRLLEQTTAPKVQSHLMNLIDKLLEEKEKAENEQIKLQNRLERTTQAKINKTRFYNDLQNWGKIFWNSSTDLQREMILSVVDKVEYNTDTRKAHMFLKINPAFLHANSRVLSYSETCRSYIEHKNLVKVKRTIEVNIM